MKRPDLASLLVQSALSHWREKVLLLPEREGWREGREEEEEEEGGWEGGRELPACYAEAMKWLCRLGASESTADSSMGGEGGREGGKEGGGGETMKKAEVRAREEEEEGRKEGSMTLGLETLTLLGILGGGKEGGREGGREGGVGPLGLSLEEVGGLLTTVGKAYLKKGDTLGATRMVREMVGWGVKPAMEVCNDLLRQQGKQGRIEGMFHTLDVMREGGLHPDIDSYQHLGNTLVRSVEFVAGAVSMDTLPVRVLPEVRREGGREGGRGGGVASRFNRPILLFASFALPPSLLPSLPP